MNEPNRWPHLGGLFYAVFNSRESHRDKGRKAVLERYGAKEWKRVLACKRTGVMEIFEHDPFPALTLFAETTADAAEAYHANRYG